MVHLARRGRLVAAGPAAVLVPQDHRAADRGGDLGAVPDVQRQAGPGQPGAQLPGTQEGRQPAGAETRSTALPIMAWRSISRACGVGGRGPGGSHWSLARWAAGGAWPGRSAAWPGWAAGSAAVVIRSAGRGRRTAGTGSTRSSRAAGSIWPVTTGMIVASRPRPRRTAVQPGGAVAAGFRGGGAAGGPPDGHLADPLVLQDRPVIRAPARPGRRAPRPYRLPGPLRQQARGDQAGIASSSAS